MKTLLILFFFVSAIYANEENSQLADQIELLQENIEENFGLKLRPVRGQDSEEYRNFLEGFGLHANATNLRRRFVPRSLSLTIASGTDPMAYVETIREQYPIACTSEARELNRREMLLSKAIIDELWWFRNQGVSFESEDMALRRITPRYTDMEELLKAYLHARTLIESGEYTGSSIVLKRPGEAINPHLENDQALVLYLGQSIAPQAQESFQRVLTPEREPLGLDLGCEEVSTVIEEEQDTSEDLPCRIVNEASIEILGEQTAEVLGLME